MSEDKEKVDISETTAPSVGPNTVIEKDANSTMITNWTVSPAGEDSSVTVKTSWKGAGGLQYAAYPHQASAAEQMLTAERLLDLQGWGAWPTCARKLGLR